MALGAAPARVRAMVLRQVAVMTLIGGAIGLGRAPSGSAAAPESLLFEMKGCDPMVLAVSAVALTMVALGAGFIPAHRASRVDPMKRAAIRVGSRLWALGSRKTLEYAIDALPKA